jgi:hypothetical protein
MATYTIRVSGCLGRTALSAFPELCCEVRDTETVLVGEVSDRSALYGIVDRLDALGLELIDIRREP